MKQFSSANTKILLEAGTNELEVLVFSVAGLRCGVNVAKIREVLELTNITPTPGNHRGELQGVIRVRDMVVPLANLSKCLFPGEALADRAEDQVLLLEFNDDVLGFRVNSVERIHRLSWQDVHPLPEVLGIQAPVTGIVLLKDEMIPMLDFESLGVRLGMTVFRKPESTAQDAATAISDHVIVFADDSPLLREMVRDRLTEAGFTNLHGFRDGQEAWDYLSELADNCPEGEIARRVSALVTDIEMPRMDGLTLTRHIRSSPALGNLPVILFSSIASDANENKAQQVGANAQVPKSQAAELGATLTRLLTERGAIPQPVPAKAAVTLPA